MRGRVATELSEPLEFRGDVIIHRRVVPSSHACDVDYVAPWAMELPWESFIHRRHMSHTRVLRHQHASPFIAPRAQEASEAKRAQRTGGRLSGKRARAISGGQDRVQN